MLKGHRRCRGLKPRSPACKASASPVYDLSSSLTENVYKPESTSRNLFNSRTSPRELRWRHMSEPQRAHCNSNLLQGHWENQRARQCWVTLLPKPLRTPGWTEACASANNVAWTAQAGGERQSEPRTTVSSLTTHPSPKLPPPGACGFQSFLHPHSPSPHQLALFPHHRTKIS